MMVITSEHLDLTIGHGRGSHIDCHIDETIEWGMRTLLYRVFAIMRGVCR